MLLKGKELTATVKITTKKKNINGIVELFNLKVVYDVLWNLIEISILIIVSTVSECWHKVTNVQYHPLLRYTNFFLNAI